MFLYLAGLRGARKVAGMRWEELPGMTLGMRWEELPGMRWEAPPGVRCTKFLEPGVPRFSRGARCTTFFPDPVEAKGLGKAITLRVFLGFVVPIVV